MATWETPAWPRRAAPPGEPIASSSTLYIPPPPRGSLNHSKLQPFQLHQAVNSANPSGDRKFPRTPKRNPIDLVFSCDLLARVGYNHGRQRRSSAQPARPVGFSGAGAAVSSSVRCGSARGAVPARQAGGGLEEDHYWTLRLAPGATRGEVKKAFHRLALQYHPDVARRQGGGDEAHQENSIVEFERINAAYQTVMRNMREAEATLEYWRRRYGLADEDLERYGHYLNDDDEDDWFANL